MVNIQRVKEYIKCPKCGEEAELDPEILTSYPPQRRWRCKHCGEVGTDYCENLDIYVHRELEKIDALEAKDVDSTLTTNSFDESYLNVSTIACPELCVYSKCIVCDCDIEIPLTASFYVPYICDECKEILKHLVDVERKRRKAWEKLAELL